MRKRLDFDEASASIAGRLTPSARLCDELLRTTFVQGGFAQALEREASLVVVYGIRPVDAAALHLSAQQMIGGGDDDFFQVDAKVYDWTDPGSQRPNYVERLVLEVSVATRPMIVLCGSRSQVPAVIATIADAVLPLADRREPIAACVERVAGFHPDDALVARLANLPLTHLNLVLRPGVTGERMWTVAGRLRRVVDMGDGRKGKAKNERRVAAKTPVAAAADHRPDRLEDMPGMGEARSWGLSLAADLARYRAKTLTWGDIENGAVLFGPPGTGKTLFAKALAGSCGVPLLSHSVAAWQAKGHLGDMLKAMRAAFDEARKAAPCVLFVDELDSVGSREEPLGEHASYQRQVVNGFLECLDGIVGRAGVVVVGATNNLTAIDTAVLRPGRLGRHIRVELPDAEGRVGILRHHLRGELVEVDLTSLAEDIGEVSGAVLAQLVREARAAARRAGRALRESDLADAVPKGILLSEAAFRRVCVHEAGHVIVGSELASVSGLVPASATVRRWMRNGDEFRTELNVIEGFDTTRESVEATIVMLLAGVAAEEVLLGSRGVGSGGAADADLVRATQLARSAERSLGLGKRLSSVPMGTSPAEDDVLGLAERVEQLLSKCLREAKAHVQRRRAEVESVAKELSDERDIQIA
ncbi:AAA family ATPase [Aureimonas sp. AU4]|uniref:AAA family ATPase n=1 Tax=Aureimonas sp. AU4 TaxID=1638163 RepID=UPI000780BC05|nr:AAA family ATPase [Aureimonas sp. AU4]